LIERDEKAIAGAMEHYKETIASLKLTGIEFKNFPVGRHYARTAEVVERNKQLYAMIADVVANNLKPPRTPERRASWHIAAQLVAIEIEWRYRQAGCPPPTRRSISSPLVLVIQRLLKMVGVSAHPDAIRKALRPRQ
jgi:hypothetical protein